MKISYKWLNEWIDLTGITPEMIADRLTNAGIEVDEVVSLDKGVENVVVGKVLSAEKHPDADKLRVCTVDVGEQTPLQIVCGAANVAAGQLVPVAIVGAVLPGNFKIKKSKLRGIESQGMICSGKELGLEVKYLPKELQEGIYVFPEEYPLGSDVREALNLDDTVLDLDLTPNRSDCLSVRGVAYEMAALLDRPLKKGESAVQESRKSIDELITVDVQAPELCPRYTARIVKNVKIAPSPMWLRNKLQAIGVRSINNIVDMTNLILMEYGQPMHAFDYDKISGKQIIVRNAREGEIIKTLDGTDRRLTADMLVIADEQDAVAVAGVMGGWESEVTESTTNILLESAYFNSLSVRKTSTALGLRSEASIRYEKGTDPNVVIDALNYAVHLVAEIGGGEIVSGLADSNDSEIQPVEIRTSVERINKRLGTEISKEQMENIFRRLQFTLTANGEEWNVKVPSRRKDITIEEDLSEEVARLYGYENIPTTLPVGQSTQGKLNQEQQARRRVRDSLLASGWDEVVSYSFVNPAKVTALGLDDVYGDMIALKMPISEERSHLRTTMLPSLLELAEYNNNHKNDSVRLFELGKVFLPKQLPLQEQPEERTVLAGIAYGAVNENHWRAQQVPVDFFYVKGIVEQLLAYFGIARDVPVYKAVSRAAFHPGQTASIEIDGQEIGVIGQIHPQVVKDYALPKAFYFEINFHALLQCANLFIQHRSLPRYPAIKRDLAIVVPQATRAQDIMATIRANGGELLTDLQLFDLYVGKGVADGKKSLAYALTFQATERTLTDEEIQAVIQTIVTALESQCHAELRA